MFPARDAPVVARRALRFERTPGASRGPVLVQGHAVLDGGKALDGSLAGRAAILIVFGDVNKVALVEATLGLAVGGQRFGHQRSHASLVTPQNLRPVEVTVISNDRQVFLSRRTACLRGHREQLGAVMA